MLDRLAPSRQLLPRNGVPSVWRAERFCGCGIDRVQEAEAILADHIVQGLALFFPCTGRTPDTSAFCDSATLSDLTDSSESSLLSPVSIDRIDIFLFWAYDL